MQYCTVHILHHERDERDETAFVCAATAHAVCLLPVYHLHRTRFTPLIHLCSCPHRSSHFDRASWTILDRPGHSLAPAVSRLSVLGPNVCTIKTQWRIRRCCCALYLFFFLVEINLKKKISILLFWYKYGIRLYSMRCDALNDRTTRDLFARVGTQRHTRVHSRTSSTGARDSDADKELRTGIQKTCMRASMRDLSFSRSLSVTDGRGRLGLI